MSKKIRVKNNPSQRYWVGAEVFVHKDKEDPHNVDAKLVKFGAKGRQAQQWLRSFAPINTPGGDELKRMVFRLPFGYRERKDVIEQYKRLGLSHENARFRMLSDHAGPNNALIYVKPTEQDPSGSDSDKPDAQESQPQDGTDESTLP